MSITILLRSCKRTVEQALKKIVSFPCYGVILWWLYQKNYDISKYTERYSMLWSLLKHIVPSILYNVRYTYIPGRLHTYIIHLIQGKLMAERNFEICDADAWLESTTRSANYAHYLRDIFTIALRSQEYSAIVITSLLYIVFQVSRFITKYDGILFRFATGNNVSKDWIPPPSISRCCCVAFVYRCVDI